MNEERTEVFTSGYNWKIVEKVSLNTLLTNCESHHVIVFSEDSSPVRGTKRKLEEGEEEEEDDWDINVNWLCWQFLTKGTELLVNKGSYFCFQKKIMLEHLQVKKKCYIQVLLPALI
jgi:hypothetical protein